MARVSQADGEFSAAGARKVSEQQNGPGLPGEERPGPYGDPCTADGYRSVRQADGADGADEE